MPLSISDLITPTLIVSSTSSASPTASSDLSATDSIAIAAAVIGGVALILSCLACVCTVKYSRIATDIAFMQIPQALFELSFYSFDDVWFLQFENVGPGAASISGMRVVDKDGKHILSDETKELQFGIRAVFEHYLDLDKNLPIKRQDLYEQDERGSSYLKYESKIYSIGSNIKKRLLELDDAKAKNLSLDFKKKLRKTFKDFCKKHDLEVKIRKTYFRQAKLQVFEVTLRLPMDGTRPVKNESVSRRADEKIVDHKLTWSDLLETSLVSCDETRAWCV